MPLSHSFWQDGPLQPGETPTVERATWPRTVKNFLSPVDATFAKNFPLLAEHNLSFDLQCNPSQLADAAAFLSLHPNVPVVLDHIGSLRLHRGTKAEDEAMLSTWKQGMEALAALPNVHVKLSMVGYSVDGWNKDSALEAEVVSAFRTCIDLFGTKRCMVRSPCFARYNPPNIPHCVLCDRIKTWPSFWWPRPLLPSGRDVGSETIIMCFWFVALHWLWVAILHVSLRPTFRSTWMSTTVLRQTSSLGSTGSGQPTSARSRNKIFGTTPRTLFTGFDGASRGRDVHERSLIAA